MKRLRIELARQAKAKGICPEWHETLKKTQNIKELASMFLRGIDFCTENDYPSIDFIRANFKGKVEEYGIHLDESVRLTNPRKTVLLGKSEGIIELDGFTVAEVFLKHDSTLELKASGNSFVMVSLFEKTSLTVTASDHARVRIRKHGGSVTYSTSGDGSVKILSEQKIESVRDSNLSLNTSELTDVQQ